MAARTTRHPIVGTVLWEDAGGGRIRLLDGWARENVGGVRVPQLVGIPAYGGREFQGYIYWYKPAIPQLLRAWAEVAERGLMGDVLFWGGSFVPRMVRGSTRTPSNHSFGTAFDINVRWNGMGREPAAVGSYGSVRELVPIFEKHGFRWGGEFRRKDGMHFEVRELVDVQGKPVVIEFEGVEHEGRIVKGETWVRLRKLAEMAGLRVNYKGGKPPRVELERGE